MGLGAFSPFNALPGAPLFQRVVRVTLIPAPVGDYKAGDTTDAIVIENLRAAFKVTKDAKPEPNPAKITITNLSAATRGRCSERGLRVILEAGYPQTIAQIFSGDATYVDHVRDGADWNTTIECGDGQRAVNFARVNQSFGGDTKAAAVVRKVTSALGLDPGNLDEQLADVQTAFSQGYSARGRAADEMNRLMKTLGLEWSIQDGRLQVLRPGQALRDLAISLSPTSGLIGSPEHGSPENRGEPPVVKVKTLLQPTVRVGGLVNVDSENVHGTFRITKLEHTGDTKGGDFYTDLEVTA